MVNFKNLDPSKTDKLILGLSLTLMPKGEFVVWHTTIEPEVVK